MGGKYRENNAFVPLEGHSKRLNLLWADGYIVQDKERGRPFSRWRESERVERSPQSWISMSFLPLPPPEGEILRKAGIVEERTLDPSLAFRMTCCRCGSGRLLLFFLACLSLLPLSFAQTEEQRKYAFEQHEGIEQFILSSDSTEQLSTHFHSKNTYYDIYLDTPDFLLKSKGYSLRLRKRVTKAKKRPITYAFQLKSEMTSLNSVRMEVDETELDFYLVKSGSNWVPMPDLMDSIFAHFEHRPEQVQGLEVKEAISLIQSWIRFKAEGAVAPFQKLVFLGLETEVIQSLTPVACGITTRMRSHIYASREQSKQLKLEKNRVKENKLPEFFAADTTGAENNWLLESSLDVAAFYPLYSATNPIARIYEYEVENKYYQPEVGRKVLEIYEKELKERFHAVPKLDSKYRQSLQQFEEG